VNIQRAAEASGLTADTIRFYEKKGVLPAVARLPNGYRDYTDLHVATLRLAKGLRDLGTPLDEVAAILPVAHDGSCGDVRETLSETLSATLSEIESRIEELSRTRSQLGTILDGLREMRPEDSRVPGMTPCGCVRLVSSGAEI
jgi:DNA-binding transcriptional MerR regulator